MQVKVEPHLTFKLNGASFDSGAQATPFAQTKTGELKLAMADLDLAPYLGYLPASLPVRVTRGSVSAALSLQFAVPQTGAPSVALKGRVGANDVTLTDASGAPLLGWQSLQLDLRDVQPLARKLAFGSLHLDALQLQAMRDAAGKINLLSLTAPRSGQAPAVAPASTASSAQVPAAPGWQIGLDTLELAAAQIRWNDAAVKPAATRSSLTYRPRATRRAIGCQLRAAAARLKTLCTLSMAFRMVRSLRILAAMATFFGLPVAIRRLWKTAHADPERSAATSNGGHCTTCRLGWQIG